MSSTTKGPVTTTTKKGNASSVSTTATSKAASDEKNIVKTTGSLTANPNKKQKLMTTAETTTAATANISSSSNLIESTLSRLTRGLPKRELRLMISEADACEPQLVKDIELLERILAGEEGLDETDANTVLESSLTPLDTYWTISSLLGRLQDDLALPSIFPYFQHQTPPEEAEGESGGEIGTDSRPPSRPSSSRSNTPTGGSATGRNRVSFLEPAETAVAMVELQKCAAYTAHHDNTASLLATWKKISANKKAAVFKRPVKPEDAPGYTDRIVFPMDLSMIRKMIVAGKVLSFADMHQYIGLISHNCVKYNGRVSDYGAVAIDFEAMADTAIRQAVLNHQAATSAQSSTTAPTVTAPTSDASSKNSSTAAVTTATTSAAAVANASAAVTTTVAIKGA